MSHSIGFVGAGRMATALGQGISSSPQFADFKISCFDPSDAAADAFLQKITHAERCQSLGQLADRASILLLAVKPQVIAKVLNQLKPSVNGDHLVVSVAAGISIATFEQQLGTKRIVRVMPNTPCLIGKGMSGMAVSSGTTEDDRRLVTSLMGAVGEVLELDEPMMDAVTGVSGSGPAYVFSFAQALVSGGQKCGLSQADSRMLAVQTILGAAELIKSAPDKTLSELTAQVTSPGGTTLAGLNQLEQANFENIVEKAVIAARDRSIELSQT